MDVNELRKMSLVDLNEELLSLRREQFNLRMQKATGQLSKPHVVRNNRRTIARLKTVMGELEKQTTTN